ncbi:HNH endonuclease signature motif containing protein [Rhodococcus sp. BE178]|uniref:HNH endonuclease signature motif containing protein n=1 Tax=Rhodococcus sp. BE178 TaxID=2817737 RepID=UPI003D1DF5F7
MSIQFAPATKKAFPAPAWAYEHRLLRRAEVDVNGCWRWTGPLNPAGYGSTIRAWRKGWLPHRLAYTVMVAPIPDGLQIDHLCRIRNCINPQHLEAVTQAENLRRQGAAVTHCPRGHEYTTANTYRSADNLRRCRTCARERQRKTVNA